MWQFFQKWFFLCKTQSYIFLQEKTTLQTITLQTLQSNTKHNLHPNFPQMNAANSHKQNKSFHNQSFLDSLKRLLNTQGKLAYPAIIAALIFWLPLWSFMLIELLGFWGNILIIISSISVVLLYYTATSQPIVPRRLLFKQLFLFNKLASHLQMPLIILSCLTIGIILLHILHKNPYLCVSLSYPISISILLFLPRQYRFYLGFFIGVFGFYWMSLSLRFEDASEFIPLLVICIGLVYAILFSLLLYFQALFFRILAVLALSIIHPFGFNWLNLVFFSSYTIFIPSLMGLTCLAICLSLIMCKTKIAYCGIFLAIASYDYNFNSMQDYFTTNKILKIVQTNYAQDYRWLQDNQATIIQDNMTQITKAIHEGYKMILLPETSFPFSLNHNKEIFNALLAKSREIIIYAGGIRLQDSKESAIANQNITQYSSHSLQTPWTETTRSKLLFGITLNTKRQDSFILDLSTIKNHDKQFPSEEFINPINTQEGFYNSYYIFTQGVAAVADKVVLVPFGETLPFQQYLAGLLERFNITFGFNTGEKPLSLTWDNHTITIANCYEATLPLPYQTGAKHILVGSNNAWFSPSIQHFMQQMIIKYYARHYQSFVYHATNITPETIITPNNGADK
ncbi:hypothetical protein CQA66_06275 [Helicobacter aurati]|uniref:CN hydrolase domain-containing protein n=1 Tax=Helicobacter aurati TaxID=137778 RepID=A0A3D8J203_9HELI|nr:hypothetical protein [Helicobacter aurati]RDU71562.1 hypothetical protein CQA66_06275 [Helicobacter aurati]